MPTGRDRATEAMWGEDLEAESRVRKERISKLFDGLQAAKQQVSAKAVAERLRVPPAPPVAPEAAAAASQAQAHAQAQAQSRARARSPVRRLPPAPRSPVKERVASALLQQCQIEERAKQRRERAAVLQREAEGRVRKQKEDEHRFKQSKVLEEEVKLRQYQMEHKLQVSALKDAATTQAEEQSLLKEKRFRADAFRRKQLLIRCGFAPMLRLLEIARNQWFTAINFNDDSLLQQAWVALYGFCANKKKERIRKEYRQASLAVSHYKFKLVQSVFRRWSLHRRMLRAKAVAVTGHFSRFTANRRAWRAWRSALEKSRRQTVVNLRMAKPKGDLCVLKHCFGRWSEYMRERLLEVEVNARADLKWGQIQALLST